MKRLGLIATALLFLLTACSQPEYYHVEEGRIVRQGQSRYFIGTDVPYAPRLASENPERLCSAVDAQKDLGISCLRIPVSESSLDGLDTVLKELDKREMSAILYLGDSLDLKGIVSRYRKDPAVFNWQIGMGSVPASDDKETYYYRGAYCDVIRAIDFVASLDRTDPARIIARGDSQGGAFTWIAASLDKRIAAAAPAVPFLGDFPHYAQIVGWPMGEILAAARSKDIPEEDLYKTLSYFDVKNFTDRITCPLYMSFGLQDPTCPPHTEFAAYNHVRSDKAYFCVPLCGHAMWQQESWTKERMS